MFIKEPLSGHNWFGQKKTFWLPVTYMLNRATFLLFMIACHLKLIFFVSCDAKLLWYLTKATAKCTFEPRTKSQEKVTQSQKSNCH